MKSNLIQPITESHKSYLTDESKEEGFADSISFPTTKEEVQEILQSLRSTPVTYQGTCTGFDGLAVPHGGHIMNFSKMNHILEIGLLSNEEGYAIVEPGVSLADLRQAIQYQLKSNSFFWPPSPTETTATIGGIAATNAYGMNSCHYGETRQYIRDIVYASSENSVNKAPIVQLTLRLLKRPSCIWGIALFFGEWQKAVRCADALQNYRFFLSDAWIQSMEYIDQTSISLVEDSKSQIPAIRSIPSVPEDTQAMIILEVAGEEDSIEKLLLEIMELTADYGSDPDTAWALTGQFEVEKLHDFRHAATEAVFQCIETTHQNDSRIVRLGTNYIPADKKFSEAMFWLYDNLFELHLTGAVCSHINQSDIHVNILPKNYDDFMRGKQFLAHLKNTF